MKRALITGITGQDIISSPNCCWPRGMSSELIRRASTFNTSRIDHLYVVPTGRTAVSTMVT